MTKRAGVVFVIAALASIASSGSSDRFETGTIQPTTIPAESMVVLEIVVSANGPAQAIEDGDLSAHLEVSGATVRSSLHATLISPTTESVSGASVEPGATADIEFPPLPTLDCAHSSNSCRDTFRLELANTSPGDLTVSGTVEARLTIDDPEDENEFVVGIAIQEVDP